MKIFPHRKTKPPFLSPAGQWLVLWSVSSARQSKSCWQLSHVKMGSSSRSSSWSRSSRSSCSSGSPSSATTGPWSSLGSLLDAGTSKSKRGTTISIHPPTSIDAVYWVFALCGLWVFSISRWVDLGSAASNLMCGEILHIHAGLSICLQGPNGKPSVRRRREENTMT